MQPTRPQWSVWLIVQEKGTITGDMFKWLMVNSQVKKQEWTLQILLVTFAFPGISPWRVVDIRQMCMILGLTRMPDRWLWKPLIPKRTSMIVQEFKSKDHYAYIAVPRSIVSYSQKIHESILNHILWSRMRDGGRNRTWGYHPSDKFGEFYSLILS